ncbi:MAG: Holliday junction branch migration protein RuvA [Rikenellaceae bacterium]|nr:Holliday junction branch migration protein RuvA [Rikenellaceae bacterium]
MYEYIKGNVSELNPAYAVVEAAGVGYYLNISLQTYSGLEGGREAKLLVHYIVREDAQILYGFLSREERDIFRMLIAVSGVGGNTARMILSTYAPGELVNIISSENAGLLKNVKGLGLKTAQKIIVELRDKIAGIAAAAGSPPEGAIPAGGGGCYQEALAALTMLGFSRAASDKTLRSVIKARPDITVEEAVRQSLKQL